MQIILVQGDITRQQVDAIVNAANSSLLGGGGVDGAIHRRGGPQILAECRRLRQSTHRDGLPAGQAVATTAGRLPARWVIHTVGPVYSRGEDRSVLLASCYRESLRVADELGARTVAFPAISAGIYGWPAADAATRPASVTEARFVLFSADIYRHFENALAAVARGEDGTGGGSRLSRGSRLSGQGRRTGRTRAGWPGIPRAWPARPTPCGSRRRSPVPAPCRSSRRRS